jgi:Animal haem peroxidase
MAATAPAHPVRDHCLAPARPVDAPIAPVEGRYGRLLPDLEPLGGDDEVLLALGAPGGLCDATGRDEPEGDEAAGWPFFGQFLAHDITADRSPIGPQADPETIANFRAPRINLECVYGAGPVGAPFLYDRDDPAKLLVGADDVPRNAQGIALLGDPRNDVHRFISQLHVWILRAHNELVDRLREDGVDDAACFDAARRALMWHVQWVVVEEFLPGLVGRDLVDELLDAGRRCYRPRGTPFIPFEFADAAFRYGHGQIRDAYRLNDRAAGISVFPDLIGFGPVPPDHVIDPRRLFGPDAQRAKRMDGRLAPSLIRLPVALTGAVDVDAYHSLAARDLQRGAAIALPSGEAVARAMGAEPLGEETGLADHGWTDETPLWLYVQLEAAARGDGTRLGPVGGRIVSEVLLGLLDADPESYRALDPGWSPTLPCAGERFGLLDLLTTAGDRAAAR